MSLQLKYSTDKVLIKYCNKVLITKNYISVLNIFGKHLEVYRESVYFTNHNQWHK